ncbi:MAG: dimethyl sulfoxide reductase anchor subunit [Rhizobiales bacterium]|nr:dimethyl sulfoxide reductase anchor subunit [Hyphomicrobiales bacterium]
MHPAYSVIIFTTASGAGYGLLALLGLVGFNHGPASNFWFGLASLLIGLGLVTIGLLSSTLHLGHPERAWRAFSQWRSSWLSREGVAAVITYVPILAFGLVWLNLVERPDLIGPLGIASLAGAAITVFCTAKIYSSLKTIRAWANPFTVPVYLVYALATGATLLMAIASVFDRWQPFQAYLAAFMLVGTIVLKFLYWRSIDGAERTHTIGDATGLGRIGAVRQWEVPHTAQNFVMKEMGYSVARRHAQRLRLMVYALLAASLLLTLLTLVALPIVFSVLAALAAFVSAVIQRWLFFAEAQHVVSLYYGAQKA